ncbi:MAG: pirin family protein [Woeseiaceae bacterium]|nr:pirin family protein [Woeseiaceae bacterium]
MSYEEARQPECEEAAGSVDLLIRPKEKNLGEFTVRRVLPAPERKMVGPFIFFDHMGPAGFAPGQGIQVRPHPHIGIATITYLFEGEIMHADSLGFHQPIQAGAVNLMTAGRGIVHSERAGSDLDRQSTLHGIQSWMALPDGQEEIAPAFAHTPAAAIPALEQDGALVRVIMGEAYGGSSPVTTYSPTLYLHCQLSSGAELSLPTDYDELAFYVVSGQVRTGDIDVPAGVMMVASPNAVVSLRASQDACVMVVGGAPVGERHIDWNFVSSSRDRIEAAKQEWRAGGFDRIDGDDEFIPLPA